MSYNRSIHNPRTRGTTVTLKTPSSGVIGSGRTLEVEQNTVLWHIPVAGMMQAHNINKIETPVFFIAPVRTVPVKKIYKEYQLFFTF